MSAKQYTGPSAWDTISVAQPQLRFLIDSLQNNTIPDTIWLTQLRGILCDYILELDRTEELFQKFGSFSFQDTSLQGTSDRVIVDEMSQKPDAFQILSSIATKKLIRNDDTNRDTIEWLIRTNYLAPVSCALQDSNNLCSITSKGYSCLSKQKIRSRFCDEQTADPLPKTLRIPPEDWDVLSLYQASVIMQYYDQAGIRDYLIFPNQDKKNVLLGCEISSEPDIRYVCAWIDAPAVLPGWLSCMLELLNTQSISHITAVCRDKEEIGSLQDAVKNAPNADKIQISCLEVSE